MEKVTVEKFVEMSGCDIDSVNVSNGRNVVAVYLSDDDEYPLVGTEYDDGTFGICGLAMDSIVTKDVMMKMLSDYAI